MFWRELFAAESCNIPNTISLTLAAPHRHQRSPYTHKKASTRPLPRTYTSKPFKKKPWNLRICCHIVVEKHRSFGATCYLHRHTFTIISFLHARPYFTREQSLCHFSSARLTSGTSMCHESVRDPNETISNTFFKYGVQKTNTNGITLNHNTWVPIHGILE
jgi:hypothetical protein